MTGDGGLIALSLAECDRLLRWGRDALVGVEHDDFDDELYDRLSEWRARHTPETAT